MMMMIMFFVDDDDDDDDGDDDGDDAEDWKNETVHLTRSTLGEVGGFFGKPPPMAKHQNILKQTCFYKHFALVSPNKLLMPLIKPASRYASSQIYAFSKTELSNYFTRSGLFFGPKKSRTSNKH